MNLVDKVVYCLDWFDKTEVEASSLLSNRYYIDVYQAETFIKRWIALEHKLANYSKDYIIERHNFIISGFRKIVSRPDYLRMKSVVESTNRINLFNSRRRRCCVLFAGIRDPLKLGVACQGAMEALGTNFPFLSERHYDQSVLHNIEREEIGGLWCSNLRFYSNLIPYFLTMQNNPYLEGVNIVQVYSKLVECEVSKEEESGLLRHLTRTGMLISRDNDNIYYCPLLSGRVLKRLSTAYVDIYDRIALGKRFDYGTRKYNGFILAPKEVNLSSL